MPERESARERAMLPQRMLTAIFDICQIKVSCEFFYHIPIVTPTPSPLASSPAPSYICCPSLLLLVLLVSAPFALNINSCIKCEANKNITRRVRKK